ncbi:MAG TPA: hypothetical protein DD405_05820 [Desulfobacteraceae bacterium]|nr:hypothetical protein [Desulfobacteraceae bacterium]
MKTISSTNPARLQFSHPLVKQAVSVMKTLGIAPVSENSESELSIFLANDIPAVTLGVSKGNNYHLENGSIEIEPIFTGIAQIIGVLLALDSGECDV